LRLGVRMAKKRVSTINISKRIVEIGHEVYPVANIARVRAHTLEWLGKYRTFYPLRQIFWLAFWVFVVVALVIVGPEYADLDQLDDISSAAEQFITIVLGLAAIRGIWLIGVLLYRMLLRPKFYSLILETAGAQSAALHGTDLPELMHIRDLIVEAIENPLFQAITYHTTHNFYEGDKFAGQGYTVNKAGRDFHQRQ
jgi:hypothetical protein